MTSGSSNKSIIPGIDPYKIVYRGQEGFKVKAYQYGTTSHARGAMEPAAIISPTTVADIQAAVEYAKENNIAVAVRSGGHAYNGCSSTSGRNIQLDLKDSFKEFQYHKAKDQVRCGVSLSLLEFSQNMKSESMFLPHGQCAHVHVGGHVQTGGYGQASRSHGLFCDHVIALEIVNAEGRVRKIHRPKTDAPDADNDDLFWAFLGASPGNFGILTHVTFKPLHDADYPDSRGMKIMSIYSKEKLRNVVQIITEMNDNNDCARDFDFSLTLFGSATSIWYIRDQMMFAGQGQKLTVDQDMLLNHGEEYGSGVPHAEAGDMDIPAIHPAVIQVWVQWANVNGKSETFGEEESAFFARIKEALSPNVLDGINFVKSTAKQVLNFQANLFGVDLNTEDYDRLDYTQHRPMSELQQFWVYRDVREFVMPYEKRGFLTDKTELSTNGYVDWLVDRIDTGLNTKGIKPVLQLQPYGGQYSMIRDKEAINRTAHSFRDKMTMFASMDCFYEIGQVEGTFAQRALDYSAKNDLVAGPVDGENFLFSNSDMRLLAFSYSRPSDPEGGSNLDLIRDKYFEEERYNRALAIKRKVDPAGVFTANTFAIGGSETSAPRIYGIGHEGRKENAALAAGIQPIPLPPLKVVYRGESQYFQAAYQYGTTSHVKGSMQPAAVITPTNVEDIQVVLKYARENDLAVAVRTGGHAYSGCSSTSGKNIQLDLQDTFEEFHVSEDGMTVRCGISLSLLEFSNHITSHGMFVPHGQCAHVHVGGHVQTGGYGQIARAFGLLCDYVVALEIVTPDGEYRKVQRPDQDKPNKFDDDLFFAVMGGSPGNYGVLTHITLKPLHDKDYPKSRGMKLYSPYSKEKLEKVLHILTSLSDDDDTPRDLDFTCTVLGKPEMSWYFRHGLAKKVGAHGLVDEKLSYDEFMLLHFPQAFGDGVPKAEESVIELANHPAIISIWVQWANTGGAEQEYGEKEERYFKMIREAVAPNLLDAVIHAEATTRDVRNFFRNLFGKEEIKNDYRFLKYQEHTPMSQLTKYWVYPDVREYVMPYEKRAYISERTDLNSNGFVDWLAGRVDSLIDSDKDHSELQPVLQIQMVGGQNSKIRTGESGCDAHSWRDSIRILQAMDCFYQVGRDANPNNAKIAAEWQIETDKQIGSPDSLMSQHDRRLIAFSYSRPSDPEGGSSLDALWDRYFDSKKKYDRLLAIKNEVDPNRVLSPNKFGVGAQNAPEILGNGHRALRVKEHFIPVDQSKVIYQGDPGFKVQAYQYGTTSHAKESMKPSAIVSPTCVEDIQAVVNYARNNNISVAVRTGGHAYCGCSSTSGKNIQIDLKDTFETFEMSSDRRTVRCGVSLSLLQLNTLLVAQEMFLPHGVCAHVHLGGHMQTGGYGQNLRAHGMICDHIDEIEIVTADGVHRKISRPDPGRPNAEEDDIFFSALGGSPGNFGVVTHVTLRPLHDKDYPNSRGMKLVSLYSKKKFEKLMQLLAKWNDNKDLPRDFDLNILVMSDVSTGWYRRHTLDKLLGTRQKLPFDQYMMLNHPKEYGDGVASAEEGKLVVGKTHPAAMQVWVQWANTGGKSQPFTDKEAQVFREFEEALSPNFLHGVIALQATLEQGTNFFKRLIGAETSDVAQLQGLSYKDHTPMSQLSRHWVYPDVREYIMPYEKRSYVSNKTDLSTNGWVDWIVDLSDPYISGDKHSELKIILQLQPFGGKHSMLRKDDGATCHSYRQDATLWKAMDCFYEEGPGTERRNVDHARKWGLKVDECIGPHGKFSEADRRYVAFAHARKEDPMAGTSLDDLKDVYFDSEKRYQRVLRTKQKVDPTGVFTANMFAVGASKLPDTPPSIVTRSAMKEVAQPSDVEVKLSDEAFLSDDDTKKPTTNASKIKLVHK